MSKDKRKKICFISTAALFGVGAAIFLFLHFGGHTKPGITSYKEKCSLLEETVLTEENERFLGKSPAGGQAGHAVFLSVCNTAERASVFCGTGPDLLSAW